MTTPPVLPTPKDTLKTIRPLLMLLLLLAVWNERTALHAMADATSATLVQLAAACGDPNR